VRGEGERGDGSSKGREGSWGRGENGSGIGSGKARQHTLRLQLTPLFARQRDEVGLHRHPAQIVGHRLRTGISSRVGKDLAPASGLVEDSPAKDVLLLVYSSVLCTSISDCACSRCNAWAHDAVIVPVGARALYGLLQHKVHNGHPSIPFVKGKKEENQFPFPSSEALFSSLLQILKDEMGQQHKAIIQSSDLYGATRIRRRKKLRKSKKVLTDEEPRRKPRPCLGRHFPVIEKWPKRFVM
jgi:hypothetical protein